MTSDTLGRIVEDDLTSLEEALAHTQDVFQAALLEARDGLEH